MPLPSVIGDFVLAFGPKAAAFVDKLEGFTRVTAPGEAAQAAVRGAAQSGRAADGTRWMALADLIEGRVEEAAGALERNPQSRWRGRFAFVAWDKNRAAASTDHFSTLSLYTLQREDLFVCGTDLRLLAPASTRTIDFQSIYHYFNFAQIPAPGTLFRDIKRLEPSTRFSWPSGKSDRWFIPEYPDDLRGNQSALTEELRQRMVATVQAYKPNEEGWGCFLSGGTDSSSIVSILAKAGKVRSFSIGFAEEGYDELGFARLAAKACGADPAFHSVSRAEAQALLSRVIADYDQPFGGASAVPTLACADLARDRGVKMLLAGDGGDEIFGGNERYAKDQVMQAFYALPGPVKAVGRTVGGALGGSSVHFLNRVENFFERASLPNPDRFYTDDSFASDHYEAMLMPELRHEVARDASLDFMRGVFAQGKSGGNLHRVMRLDLMMAIAQHDLRKVDSATRSAGVSARFPYLDPELVTWTNRLPERYKVRGLTKRYLFKKATRTILPEEILRKKKQGFGLPTAVWLRSDGAFKSMVREVLFDARTRARHWWEPAFVEKLLAEHERGAWDHADYIWRLLVLELWLRRYVDAS